MIGLAGLGKWAGVALVAMTPYLLAAVLGGWAAYAWQTSKVYAERAKVQQLRDTIKEAGRRSQERAEQSQATVDRLDRELLAAQAKAREVEVVIEKEIQYVASPAAQCFSPSTLRVLRRAQDRREPEGQDQGKPAAPDAPAPTTADRGSSERAIATWANSILAQWDKERKTKNTLIQEVRALPCVEVDEQN